ncbi:MAG: S-layer homology domain-containing protein, partial [Clostridiales bacterium]|nr:S-layer homology domain-containing protein [Clostridiales bacterium]
MSKIKKVVSIYLVFILVFSTLPMQLIMASENDAFSDVPAGHWGYEAISRWSDDKYGVIQGNGDGTFAPSRELSLGELAAILSSTFGYTERVHTTVFPE